MQKTHLLFWILLKVISGNPITQDCCASKSVGNESYTLVNNSGLLVPEECLVPCVYSRDGQPGNYFCFKSGSLPVTCIGEVSVPGCAAAGGVSNEHWDEAGILEFRDNTGIGGCVAACTINPSCTGWSVDTNTNQCILFNPSQNPQIAPGWCRGLRQGPGSNTFEEEAKKTTIKPKKTTTKPSGKGILEGPFGKLVDAKTFFSEKSQANAAITEILIHTGNFSKNIDVIVGIQTAYGSSAPGPVRGKAGIKTFKCKADPMNGIFFSQIKGRAESTTTSVNSLIYQLGFASNAGTELCTPPLVGNPLGGTPFAAPPQPSQTMDIKYFEGNTTSDNMLGSLSAFMNTIGS